MTGNTLFVRGCNDLLFDESGKRYVDLHNGFGAVFMGHCHPAITQALVEQTESLWACGGTATQIHHDASTSLANALGGRYKTAGLHSTGMEANEFVLRYARVITGKSGWAGFDGSMYGKSQATAALAWSTGVLPAPVDCHRLPFPSVQTEASVLEQLKALLKTQSIGAMLVEPVLGSSGGATASAEFWRAAAQLARSFGALVVVDEILTGFHRTGAQFCFDTLDLLPDVVVLGKTCGNGFPVSAVMVEPRRHVLPEMLPGSTYGGNPLACASVVATLMAMKEGDIGARVKSIGDVVADQLGWLHDSPFQLRGSGALWVIDGLPPDSVSVLLNNLRLQGYHLSGSGRQIRLLPASTIGIDNLTQACAAVSASLRPLTRHL